MSRFAVPTITRPVDLGAYAPEYAGAVCEMWVNPPRARILEWQSIRARVAALVEEAQGTPSEDPVVLEERGRRWLAANEEIAAWWSQMWSQHADGATHWTPSEVKELVTHLSDRDPEAWRWLLDTCLRLIYHYREEKKTR